MRVVAKPVVMVAWSDRRGKLTPLKFTHDGITVVVDKVIQMQEEKLAGNNMFVYTCQGIVEEQERLFELKYEIKSCRWMLFKM